MNLIFLDINGVLATGSAKEKASLRTGKNYDNDLVFDPVCMMNLLHIVKSTHSKIIITSDWVRNGGDSLYLMDKFSVFGLDSYVIDYSPILYSMCSEEIKECLRKYPSINYVIINSKSENLDELAEYLVQTKYYTGLNIEASDKVITKLARQR